LKIVFGDLSVQSNTLRGDTLAFGWQGPLLRNGETVALCDFPHHQSLYGYAEFPAEEMLMTHAELGMRLRFK